MELDCYFKMIFTIGKDKVHYTKGSGHVMCSVCLDMFLSSSVVFSSAWLREQTFNILEAILHENMLDLDIFFQHACHQWGGGMLNFFMKPTYPYPLPSILSCWSDKDK